MAGEKYVTKDFSFPLSFRKLTQQTPGSLLTIDRCLNDPDILELNAINLAENHSLVTVFRFMSMVPQAERAFTSIILESQKIAESVYFSISEQARDPVQFFTELQKAYVVFDELCNTLLKKEAARCASEKTCTRQELIRAARSSFAESLVFHLFVLSHGSTFPPHIDAKIKEQKAALPIVQQKGPGILMQKSTKPLPLADALSQALASQAITPQQKKPDWEADCKKHADTLIENISDHLHLSVKPNLQNFITSMNNIGTTSTKIESAIASLPGRDVTREELRELAETLHEARELFEGSGFTVQLSDTPPLYMHHVPANFDSKESTRNATNTNAINDFFGSEFIYLTTDPASPRATVKWETESLYRMRTDRPGLQLELQANLLRDVIGRTQVSLTEYMNPDPVLEQRSKNLRYALGMLVAESLLRGHPRVRTYDDIVAIETSALPKTQQAPTAAQEDSIDPTQSAPQETYAPEPQVSAETDTNTLQNLKRAVKIAHEKIPPLSYRRASKAAERAFGKPIRHGEHPIFSRTTQDGRLLTAPLPFHGSGDVPPGTLRRFLSLMEITYEDFMK